jgi:hypothetical protein
MGGLADSWYEYLVRSPFLRSPSSKLTFLIRSSSFLSQIKQAQLTSFSLPQYPKMYAAAMDATHEHLLKKLDVIPGRDDLAIIGNVDWGVYKHDVRLTCPPSPFLLSHAHKVFRNSFNT